jgi:hypothetical protein
MSIFLRDSDVRVRRVAPSRFESENAPKQETNESILGAQSTRTNERSPTASGAVSQYHGLVPARLSARRSKSVACRLVCVFGWCVVSVDLITQPELLVCHLFD